MFQTQFIHLFIARSAHTIVCQVDPDMSPYAVQVSLWLGVVVGWAPGLLEPGVTSLHFGADLGCISRRGQQGTA